MFRKCFFWKGAAAAAGEPTATDASDTPPQPPPLPKKIGVRFPPVKSQQEIAEENMQRAHTTPEAAKEAASDSGTPPVVRSILELAHVMMIGHSCKLKACPGYQGGVFYSGKPFCVSCGYRDGSKPLDMEDKANHMRLKDPMLYGPLSLPVTSMLLCQLHEEGIFDLEKPLIEYYPELGDRYRRFTGRSILKFETVVDRSAILKDAGASLWRPYVSWNACRAMQDHVYSPLSKFLSAGATKPLDGAQQRSNFLEYMRSSTGRARPKYVSLHKGRVCHLSVALLLAVVERRLGGSFEDAMRSKIFLPAQANASGYGPPLLYRDPNDMFYKPTGQALQHEGFKKPIPPSSPLNAAPPLLNGSLNLYTHSEEFAKLLFLALDTIHNARNELGKESVAYPHYDLGLLYRPDRQEYSLSRSVFTGLDFVPTSTSFRYNAEFDVGVFALSSCGTRNGRLFSNGFARALQHLFLEHVTKKGINPDSGTEDPTVEKSETEKKFKKLTDEAKYTNVFKRYDAHRRF